MPAVRIVCLLAVALTNPGAIKPIAQIIAVFILNTMPTIPDLSGRLDVK